MLSRFYYPSNEAPNSVIAVSGLTEELHLVLQVSLDGQSLQDRAQQSCWFRLKVLTASVAQVKLHLQEGLETCRLWLDTSDGLC